jgi:hypothetical protein
VVSGQRCLAESSVLTRHVASQLFCFASESADDSFRREAKGMCSDRYKFSTPRFHVLSSNEELTQALHFFHQSWGFMRHT